MAGKYLLASHKALLRAITYALVKWCRGYLNEGNILTNGHLHSNKLYSVSVPNIVEDAIYSQLMKP